MTKRVKTVTMMIFYPTKNQCHPLMHRHQSNHKIRPIKVLMKKLNRIDNVVLNKRSKKLKI